jgi:hypothetical protein
MRLRPNRKPPGEPWGEAAPQPLSNQPLWLSTSRFPTCARVSRYPSKALFKSCPRARRRRGSPFEALRQLTSSFFVVFIIGGLGSRADSPTTATGGAASVSALGAAVLVDTATHSGAFVVALALDRFIVASAVCLVSSCGKGNCGWLSIGRSCVPIGAGVSDAVSAGLSNVRADTELSVVGCARDENTTLAPTVAPIVVATRATRAMRTNPGAGAR